MLDWYYGRVSPHGEMTIELDYRLEGSEFKFHPWYYFYNWADNIGKNKNPIYPFSCGLKLSLLILYKGGFFVK